MGSTHTEAGIMTDLEGRSLDEALARAMGWKPVPGYSNVWNLPDGSVEANPPWHVDLTYLLRDIEPVCREGGMKYWMVGVEEYEKPKKAYYAHTEPNPANADFYGPTAATALARAFLAVLTRGEM